MAVDSSPPKVGLSMTGTFLRAPSLDALALVREAAESGVDYVHVGDHISFHDGTGFDGLTLAAAMLAVQSAIPVHIGLYLLALRHPVPVARQLAELCRLAPGRLSLGVGVGGEDRHEFEVCGVDPATRGRRTNEGLDLLRQLLTGRAVDYHGEFFNVERAIIAPAPTPPLQIIIGGRSDAALSRTARFGDGWLGTWVSAERYGDAIRTIERLRDGEGTDEWGHHGLVLWCALPGRDGEGGAHLAAEMERRYKMPFSRFERWCPIGTAEDIARYIARYAEAGCGHVTLVLNTPDQGEAIDQAAQVRECVAAG